MVPRIAGCQMSRLVLDGLTLTDPHIDELAVTREAVHCRGKTTEANVIAGLRRARAEITPSDVVEFSVTNNDGRTVESVGTIQILELKTELDLHREFLVFLIAVRVGIT